jgi:hypothetical protein
MENAGVWKQAFMGRFKTLSLAFAGNPEKMFHLADIKVASRTRNTHKRRRL